MFKNLGLWLCSFFLVLSRLVAPGINEEQGPKDVSISNSYVESCADVLEGSSSQSENLEETPTAHTWVLQNPNQCREYCHECGPGREDGYSDTYADACRNWQGWNFTYGSTDIPYWINMESINTIENVAHRTTLVDDIRYQASLWNLAEMHDGSGKLINLYEVGVNEATLPENINGRKVVEVLREDGDYAGIFASQSLQIKLNYDPAGFGTRPGRNVDTPMHEMGHLLGLYDLDVDVEHGTHKALMGYSRNTTTATIDSAISYHDIQGIAVVNGVHTTHSFSRYFYDGGWYKHVCFYCDTVDAWPYPLSGSSQFVYASSCAHDYEKMVSLGDKIWMKCTRCYKVVTHYHSFNDSYVSAGYHSHYAYCECGDYLSQSHNMVSNICTACGFSHTHTYDGWTYYNSTTHIESCCCGRTGTATAVHSIRASEVVDNKADCLGCGHMLDLRYDMAVSTPDSAAKVSVNGSYILPSGIIVLVDEDVEAYLNGTLVFYDKDDLPVTQ